MEWIRIDLISWKVFELYFHMTFPFLSLCSIFLYFFSYKNLIFLVIKASTEKSERIIFHIFFPFRSFRFLSFELTQIFLLFSLFPFTFLENPYAILPLFTLLFLNSIKNLNATMLKCLRDFLTFFDSKCDLNFSFSSIKG